MIFFDSIIITTIFIIINFYLLGNHQFYSKKFFDKKIDRS